MWARGRTQGFLLGPVLGLLACRVRYSLGTLLTWWDTYRDLDDGQDPTTTLMYFINMIVNFIINEHMMYLVMILDGYH